MCLGQDRVESGGLDQQSNTRKTWEEASYCKWSLQSIQICCLNRLFFAESGYSSEASELDSGFSGPAVNEARYFDGARL
jgi:hypothetical protein